MSFAPALGERQQARIAWPFATATLVWGSTWLVIESQLRYAPAGWSIAWRFLLGGLAMVVVAWRMGASLRLDRGGHALAAAIGVMQFTLNYLFVYAAEAHIASGLVALVSALTIVPNALLGWAFLRQNVSHRFLLGAGVALAGMAILFADELTRADVAPHRVLAGIGLAIAGLLAASTANVLQGTARAGRLPPPTLLAWSMAYGGLLDAACAGIADGPPVFSLAPVYVLGLLYLAIVGSAVAFSCYLAVIRAVGPARAGYVGVLTPVIAMALSTLFEGYRWSAGAAAGAGLAVAGLLVAMRARNPAR